MKTWLSQTKPAVSHTESEMLYILQRQIRASYKLVMQC